MYFTLYTLTRMIIVKVNSFNIIHFINVILQCVRHAQVQMAVMSATFCWTDGLNDIYT